MPDITQVQVGSTTYDIRDARHADYAPLSHTHSANNITTSGYLNIHPENNPTLIPFIHNDIAYLLKRGGSIAVTFDGVGATLNNVSNLFDSSPSYINISAAGITTIVVELTLHRTFNWTNIIYVDFGAKEWRAKNIKIEAMNSSYENDVWAEKLNITGNSLGNCYVITSHTPVGESSATGGFNKLRFTFSAFNNLNSGGFRIAQLGVYNYASNGLRETFLPKDGGEVYGTINPFSNNQADLGTSSKKFNNLYATSINGVALGNSPKFTDTTYSNATSSASGLMSSSDKAKLDGLNAANYTSASIFPNDTNNAKTKYRIATIDFTGSSSTYWYYPLLRFPQSNTANYASAIVSGRIGGWTNENINYFQGLMWNRGGAGISSFNISGGATSEEYYFNCVDFVIYKDSTTNEETVYIKCLSYFVFDLDVELYQSGASIIYDGTKLTTTPSGTLTAQASTSRQRVSWTNGKLLLAGTDIDSTYIKKTGDTMSGALVMQDQINTSFRNAVAMGSYSSSQHTVPNLVQEVRYSSGAAGSVEITEAYTKDGVTVPTRWYNFLWIPHRFGGKNGQASGDNCNYGALLLMGMSGTGFYILRYASETIAELRDVYKDTDTDVKVTNTLANTTKYYVTGTTNNATNTGTQSFDSGIYATTTAGQLNATTYKVNEQVTLQWNSTDQSLDFVFA